MEKWIAGAAYMLTLSGLMAPAAARAQQGGWLDKAARGLEGAAAAKRKADSVRAAARRAPNAGRDAGGDASQGGCSTNFSYQCARPVALGERIDVVTGAIGPNGQRASLFYRLSLEEPGALQFTLDPMPNRGQVPIDVADAQYQRVGRFLWQRGQPGAKLLQLSAPGTYYVRLLGGYSYDERLSLVIDRSSPSARPGPTVARAGCAANATFQCAEDVELGAPITGAIGGNAHNLYYRLRVDQPGPLRLALTTMPNRSGVVVHVTDASYENVGKAEWRVGQPGARQVPLASAGTYYLKVYTPAMQAERFSLAVGR